MTSLPTPDAFLPAEVRTLIASHAGLNDNGILIAEVIDLIYREGWLKMLVPKRWGGAALPLPQVVRLEEGLAYADGSVGWVVTLCSGAGWFGGFLPVGVFDDVLTNPRLCIAGSGAATGQAHLVGDEYLVTGSWPYASGINHATAYTANCVIWQDGAPLQGPDGQPVIKAFLFLPGEVKVRDDWSAMGLAGTGSNGFSVKELAVGRDRAFVIDGTKATDPDPLYQYPFLPLAEATLAANISGMGWHFLDCCVEYFQRKARPAALSMLAEARMELGSLRAEFYSALDDSWTQRTPASFSAVTDRSLTLAGEVRSWVDTLFPYAGLGAARWNTTINQVWRDLHTAGQHPLLVY